MIRAAALCGVLFATAGTAIAAPATTGPVTKAIVHGRPIPPGVVFRPRCADHSCKSWVAVDAHGKIVSDADHPIGFGPPDLQSAYHIDPTLGAGLTVAVVDAFGYADLESDLAVYRSTFSLPACTIASGCLTIVNDNGQTSPLPADDAEWIGETALDVDMVSAGCPMCKIVVVQAGAAGTAGLDIGQLAATKLGVDTISDSWGGPEDGNVTAEEGSFNNAGIATFVASGDNGYDSFQPTLGSGPSYPATSTFVIGVGATNMQMVDPSVNPRGWVEQAWTQSGSSCSVTIPKPSFQPATAACNMRASADVSAVGDPGTGLAVYVAKQGGWQPVGGSSAASPLVAAIFAASGHADATPAFVYKHPEAFVDVTMGQNGTCGSNLCNCGAGWDGPTGLGTPDQSKLKAIGGVAGAGPAVSITFPADGDTVQAGFTIAATPDPSATYIEIDIDNVRVKALNVAPYMFSAPDTIADGAHTVTVTAFDIDHNSQSAMINVTQGAAMMAGGDDSGGGGCSTSGRGGLGGLVLVGAALVRARRRRAV